MFYDKYHDTQFSTLVLIGIDTIMISINENHPVTSKQVVNLIDLEYLGIEKDFPKQLSVLPYGKNRSMGLLKEEKEYKEKCVKKRIAIKHVISVD